MVKARTWFTLFIVSAGTIAATASCGSSDEATGGSGGATIITGGGNTSAGTAGRVSIGRAGSGGATSSGGGGPTTGNGDALGSTCTSDAQCGDGLVCITANSGKFGGQGPSKGMCTKACDATAKTNAECDGFKAGAICADFGTETEPAGYCIDSCTTGDVADLTTKCSGRSDFLCWDFGSNFPTPYCVPHCRSDAECGAGLYCDKASLFGLCSKTKPATSGDPVGTACDPNADPTTCEQGCLRTSADGVTPAVGVCVEFCSIGSECMYGPGAKGAPGGLCIGKVSADSGPIDPGYCMANCSCTSDCFIEGDLCRKWASDESDLEDALGAPGLCYPVLAMSTELSCGEGGAGGASSGGGGAPAGGHGGMSTGGSGTAGSATGGSSSAGSSGGGGAPVAGGGGSGG